MVTVVTVRVLLELTGYPQLGGGRLHIAHLLWGGLLMFAANVVLLMYAPEWRRLCAVMAGTGFGLFIDEVGKFITADNDYFYKPALSLIYICFVVLFGLRRILWGKRRSGTSADRSRVDDPASGQGFRRAEVMRSQVLRFLTGKRVLGLVAAVFVVQALILMSTLVLLVVLELQGVRREVTVPPGHVFLAVVAFGAAAAYGALVMLGAVRVVSNVEAALVWFKRATVLNLLAVQPFHVYENQIAALLGLGLNCLAYLILDAVAWRPVVLSR